MTTLGRFSARFAAALMSIVWMSQLGNPANARDDLAAEAVDEMLVQARGQQTADLEAWSRYAFDRQVLRQRIGKDGRAYWQETLHFRVSPTDVGFDESLLSVDGHAPSARLFRSHKEAGRFAERYRELLSGDPSDTQDGYSLRMLLDMSSYQYRGIEQMRGTTCHRLDFDPQPLDAEKNTGDGIARRIADVSSGTLWLSAPGWHLVAAKAQTSRRVSVALGLARVERLQVSYIGAPLDSETWLPKRIEVLTEVKVLGRRTQKRNVFTYRRFEPSATTAGRTPAGSSSDSL